MNIKRVYNSLEACLKQVENQTFYNKNLTPSSRSSITGDCTFTETKNLEEAISLCRYGWKKGRDIIHDLTVKHENIFHKIFPSQDFDLKITSSEEGEIVNMDNYLSGQPDDMLSYSQDEDKIKKLTNAKMQRIIVLGNYGANISTDTIFNRGCIIASMINIMEIHGFRTELWMCRNIFDISKTRKIKYLFKLKDFDQDLNLNNLSFAICHPSMLRRLCFALTEQEQHDDVIRYIINSGYGCPEDLNADEILNEFGTQDFNNYGNIYFEKMFSNKTFKELLDQTEHKIKEHFTSIKI